MSYSFSSENKLVSTGGEKANNENRAMTNLMHNRRVFRGHIHTVHNIRQILSPLEQEQEHIHIEKENKRIEMLKSQIEAFKSNKVKLTPYDIRPAPMSKIPIDLQYFLTEHSNCKVEEQHIFTQTDSILPSRIKKFVPKKRGINASTQIEDGDLFNFNREVAPIVSVMTFKILEEALQEAEEEAEMYEFSVTAQKVKDLYQEVHHEESQVVDDEMLRIQYCKENIQRQRAVVKKNGNFVQKIQTLNIAKQYLEKIIPNTLNKIHTENQFPDFNAETFKMEHMDFFDKKTLFYTHRKKTCLDLPFNMTQSVTDKMCKTQTEIVGKFKKQFQKDSIREINQSSHKRLVNLLYYNEHFEPRSEFKTRLEYALKDIEYTLPSSDQDLLKDKHEEAEGDEAVAEIPEEAPQEEETKFEPTKYTSINIENLKSLRLSLANHPCLDTPEATRKYKLYWEVYSQSGEILMTQRGIKHNSKARNIAHKYSDDESLAIHLKKLSEEVHHILLFISSREGEDTGYARYHLDHHPTSQVINKSSVKHSLTLAYRIFKQDFDPRALEIKDNLQVVMPSTDLSWFLDIYNLEIPFTTNECPQFFGSIIKTGYEYVQDFTEQLKEYRMFKKRELLNYFSKVKEIEEAAQTSKKKKGKRSKLPDQPKPMTSYQHPNIIPSRTYGPYFVEKSQKFQELVDKVKEDLDSPKIYVKDTLARSARDIFKAKTLFDIRLESA